MRCQKDEKSAPVCRLLHGREVMKLQGWDDSWYKAGATQNYDNEFLCRLAGRAFSCYTFTPVCLAAFAAMGLCKGQSGKDEGEALHDSSSDS